ncbi:Aspartokinase [Entomophthora muscae]|uniref:Aspartokinase n=1 Tax=Entomophthora muscae TaxID=34485 RepID=A0ACC2RTB7_9FUNG|nr:Aspartokinase [Entomophthora muscae]
MLASQLEIDDSWTVIKFGGTETVNFIKEIRGVVQKVQSKARVAVVCSTLGSSDDGGGVSSRFARLAEEVLLQESHVPETIKEILEDHIALAQQVISSPEILSRLRKQLESDCSILELFLRALSVIKEISPHAKDVIVGTRTKLTCHIVAAALLYQGHSAELVNLESMYSPDLAEPDNVHLDHLSIRIRKTIENCTVAIPVIVGFFGVAPLGNSVECNYSEVAATLVAVSLGALELQIWKEVNGFFTTNLTRMPSTIGPIQADLSTLSNHEVNDSFTQVMGTCFDIPVSFPSSETLPSCHEKSSLRSTAITIKENVSILNIHKSNSHNLASVFHTLDLHRVTVDLIATSEGHISIAISSPSDLSPLIIKLGESGKVRHQMCIIRLAGRRMRKAMGAAARMLSALARAKIQVEMVSQASSNLNLSCVIHQSYSMLALAEIQNALL